MIGIDTLVDPDRVSFTVKLCNDNSVLDHYNTVIAADNNINNVSGNYKVTITSKLFRRYLFDPIACSSHFLVTYFIGVLAVKFTLTKLTLNLVFELHILMKQ